ncbi:D-hexose-6-phosphate mutarotase [Actinomyces naeslundii]|nr:D-hexose-6-phosphate mutarotase [Actinomyces naeslundii]
MTAPNISNPTHPAAAMNQVRLPRTAALGPGLGGQPRLLIDAPAGAAEIYLHGATLTSWVPRGGSEVIFTSRQAVFDGSTAIRGGIPLCLPEFGVGINGDAVPKHGWARIAPWQPRMVASTDDGGVRALLSVSRDHLTALYEVEVGETLRLGLSLRNDGNAPRTVEAAAHTYLSVHDVTASLISGLAGASYSDNLARSPQEAHRVQDGDVRISSPVDRIYDSAEPITVTDPGHERTIHVDKRNAPSTIVWNPWSTYSAPLPDMADDEFPTMVCVESGAVREHAPTIEPGASWSMQVILSVENTGV